MDVSQVPKDATAVTPDDNAPANGCALMVGVAGNVAITTEKGTVTTLPNVQPGVQIIVRFTRIMNTNTTASSIVIFR